MGWWVAFGIVNLPAWDLHQWSVALVRIAAIYWRACPLRNIWLILILSVWDA